MTIDYSEKVPLPGSEIPVKSGDVDVTDSPPEYFLADDETALAEAVRSLAGRSVISIDLEADGLHSYREKTCLIQISTVERNIVIDPVSCPKAPLMLGPLLADPAVEKIFHGGDFDIRLLKRDFQLTVRNVFDTMIAARITGRSALGLAALLEEFFGVVLEKKFQRADWSHRPLKPDMLAYAVGDTAYLMALRMRLEDELMDLGRRQWAEEDFSLLEEVEPPAPKPLSCFSVKGSRRLSPQQLAVLQELLEVRDRTARGWDRPPFKVVSNSVLLEWAEKPPATVRDLMASRGVQKKVLSFMADSVMDAIARGRSVPLEKCPKPPTGRLPLNDLQRKSLARLKKARTVLSEAIQLSPGLLVNSATLEEAARLEPDEGAAYLGKALKRWQRDVALADLEKALTSPG